MKLWILTSYLYFYGNAKFVNQEFGTLIFNNYGNINTSSENTGIINYGLIYKEGTSGSYFNLSVENFGTIEIPTGDLRNNSEYPFINHPEGVVTGTGTFIMDNWLDVMTNNGMFSPGLPVGKLIVRTGYTQEESGILKIDINGLIPETEHDVLQVNSAVANLNGTIQVNLGYEPSIDDEFVVLTATSGVICNLPASINTAYNNFQYTFDVICNDNDITLKLSGIQDVTSVGEINEIQNFKVYPNPIIDQAIVEFKSENGSNKRNFILSNSFGQIVRTVSLNSNQETYVLDRGDLASGVYLIQILGNEKVYKTKKIVIE